MKNLIGILLLIFLCAGCGTRIAHQSSVLTNIQGFTFDRTSGERLPGTLIENMTQGRTTASDTTGTFRLTANIGDSIRFLYVGLKDTVIVMSGNTPTFLKVGLDTVYMPLIDKGVFRREHISQTDYKPYQFDNGDDYVSCDRYRIVDETGKIGYADQHGYIIIKPKYACALPFDNGKAKVAEAGTVKDVEGSNGEYHYWESDGWYYIDLYGDRLTE